MLEYMMVREKDQPIIHQSKGKLRWILLDEAHTFTGSAASEIALLIRRVLDAFGVTADQVRFAATSATIGDTDNPETVSKLKSFMSQLTGQIESRIEIIGGRRIVPSINNSKLPDHINGVHIEPHNLLSLREEMALSAAKTCSEISGTNDIEQGLNIIDELSSPIPELLEDGKDGAILPTRGHFFARSMNGAFVCINPNCNIHKNEATFYRGNSILGTISTNVSTKCECGAPMLELVRCSRCGEFLAVGEINNQINTFRASKTDLNESIFDVENEPIENDEQNTEQRVENPEWSRVVFAKISNRLHPVDAATMGIEEDEENIYRVNEGDHNGHLGYIPSNGVCPCCKADSKFFRHLRYSSGFFNRILSSTLLEQAPIVSSSPNLIWEGRKYIAFTDSRQGTAKSALAQNIDIERIWIQSRILHHISSKRTENILPLSDDERAQLQVYRTSPNLFRQQIQDLESRDNALNDPNNLPVHPIKWDNLYDDFIVNTQITRDLITLGKAILNIPPIKQANAELITDRHKDYLSWLLMDQFSRRPKSANSPENLGFVRCVYPALSTCNAPHEFKELNPVLTDDHWRDFLKICVDYYLRDNLFVDIPDDIFKFRTSSYFYRKSIYPSDFEIPDGRRRYFRWPSFDNRGHFNRMVLLLCKAANWNTPDELGNVEIDTINDLLQRAWNDLIRAGILRRNDHGAYAVRLENSMAFEVLKKAWLCPVTNVPLDVTFMGISPRITGSLSVGTFQRFQVSQDAVIDYPCFPYANHTDNLGNKQQVNDSIILEWIDNNFDQIKELGLWSNIHERMYLKPPIYLAAEHSAQQDSRNLEIIEERFEKGELNILSCSTTMEMGVDIGGISEVVMNNVPPSPANYLQRAGRAGRRNETKSLALTFCSPNPIGRNVMDNPLWPMVNEIQLPKVRFESPNIVQRHINSYLFSKFVTTQIDNQQGLSITGKVDAFFGSSIEVVVDFIAETIYSQLVDYLISLYHELPENLNVGIDKIKRGTVLDPRNNSILVSSCLSGIRSVNRIYLDQLNEINQSIITLQNDGYTENSPAIKSLLFKRGSLTGKPLLGYLAEKLFLPNANMPTGVVEFDISNIDTIQKKINFQQRHQGEIIQEDNSSFSVISENPSFHLARALAEYAPGRQIVLNQYCYTSDGIQLKSIWNEQNMLRVQKCSNGHTSLSMFDHNICHCGSQLRSVHGTGRYTEAIEPAGFSVDIRREPSRVIDNDQLSVVETELINVSDWGEDSGVFKIESRSSLSDSEIMYYNNGNGNGFAICIHCGRAEKETEIARPGDGKLHNHKRLRGGKDNNQNEFCTGSNDNVFGIRRNNLLIGRLQTDFVELRFHDNNGYIEDKETVRSLGVVLSQALAQSLGINESEISFGLKRYQRYYTAYIYDTAKGGAGYSNQFNYYIEDILQRARARLAGCDCTKACTKCLINRSSLWYLDELDRFKALDWLNIEYETRAEVPEEIKVISPNAKQVTKEIGVELQKWLDRSSAEEFTVFIDNNSSTWNDANWGLIEKAKEFKFVHHKTVNFVTLGTPENNLVTFSIVKGLESWANVFVMDLPRESELFPLATIRMQSQGTNTSQNFYSQYLNNQFNETWGKNELVYTDDRDVNYDFQLYTPQLEMNSNLEKFYIHKKRSTSGALADVFVESLIDKNSNLWNTVESAFQGKGVTIAYSDRYVVSKFSAMLTLQFIQTLSEKLNLEIESLQLNLLSIKEEDKICLKVWDNWSTNGERNTFVNNAIRDMDLVKQESLILNVSNRLSHYRQLVIESESHVLTIQPDGGISQGWRYDKNAADYNDGDYDMIEYDEDLKLYNTTGNDGIQYFVEFE